METRLQSPEPPGAPRWVAMFYEPDSAAWRIGAESPHRSPVLHAVGEMTQTVRARGGEPAVALWGPRDGAWHRFERSTSPASGTGELPSADAAGERPAGAAEPSKLAERMDDRRHQVLMAGLGRAGRYDLTPDDLTAVQTLVERLDETTLRRVAHWLATAGAEE
ncbi:hypothetical protein [Streptomyces shenzhenensis]|uniref:hypothetical protein n=1 Tax=Streptomyces shenzhenensis TaxID=943815 RepID=UPI00369F645E